MENLYNEVVRISAIYAESGVQNQYEASNFLLKTWFSILWMALLLAG